MDTTLCRSALGDIGRERPHGDARSARTRCPGEPGVPRFRDAKKTQIPTWTVRRSRRGRPSRPQGAVSKPGPTKPKSGTTNEIKTLTQAILDVRVKGRGSDAPPSMRKVAIIEGDRDATQTPGAVRAATYRPVGGLRRA